MKQSDGFVEPKYLDHVSKLKHALYGRKQWPCLRRSGSSTAICVRYRVHQVQDRQTTACDGSTMTFALICVNDLILASNDMDLLAVQAAS